MKCNSPKKTRLTFIKFMLSDFRTKIVVIKSTVTK